MAKAYADYVLIAGHSGGTGASPLSSIRHAGSPWELGLAGGAIDPGDQSACGTRIEVRVDGGFKTGRDVVIAAMLGGVLRLRDRAAGGDRLRMARQCHLEHLPHRCRHPEARSCGPSSPARRTRSSPTSATWRSRCARSSARSAPRSLSDVIGRADLLERVERPEVPRAQMLDLSAAAGAPPMG